MLQETLPRGSQQHFRKTKNRTHTSPLGRKVQSARSRRESRRCSKRHSRGAHNNHTAHRNPPQKHATREAEDSRVQTEHFRKTKKNPHQSPGAEGSGRTLSGRTQKVFQETLPRGSQQPHSAREIPQTKHATRGAEDSRVQTEHFRKTKNWPHTSLLGRKAQGTRSLGEPRRCSKRHSRGAHSNTLERQKTSPTPVPWGGRLRVHALGRTQKVLQETLPRRTQQPHSAQEPTPKTRNMGSRRQSRPDRALQTTKKKRLHTSPLGRNAHGAQSPEEPRRCSKRHSRGAHNKQSGCRIQGAKKEHVQDTPTYYTQDTII